MPGGFTYSTLLGKYDGNGNYKCYESMVEQRTAWPRTQRCGQRKTVAASPVLCGRQLRETEQRDLELPSCLGDKRILCLVYKDESMEEWQKEI